MENYNHHTESLKTAVGKFSIDCTLEWAELLPYRNCCIQLVPQWAPTGISPFFYTLTETLTYLTLQLSYSQNLRYLGSNEGMTHLHKLRQTYMLTALNTKEAHSQHDRDKYDDIPQYKIGNLIMIKNFNKKLNWDAKYIPNFRIIRLIGTRQL